MTVARTVGPVATLTELHQITLPAEVREALGVGPGDRLEFFPLAPGEFLFYVSGRPLRMQGVIPKRKGRVTLLDMTHSYASQAKAEQRHKRPRPRRPASK